MKTQIEKRQELAEMGHYIDSRVSQETLNGIYEYLKPQPMRLNLVAEHKGGVYLVNDIKVDRNGNIKAQSCYAYKDLQPDGLIWDYVNECISFDKTTKFTLK